MKVWFEGNVLWYDAVINDVTPNFIKLDTTINSIEFDGKHVYIKGTPRDVHISNLDDHKKTRVLYSERKDYP